MTTSNIYSQVNRLTEKLDVLDSQVSAYMENQRSADSTALKVSVAAAVVGTMATAAVAPEVAGAALAAATVGAGGYLAYRGVKAVKDNCLVM